MADKDKRNANASRNWGLASIAASFVFSLLFSQYGEQLLGRLYPVFTFIWPVILIALGVFAGWQLKKWRVSAMLSSIDAEVAKAAAVEKVRWEQEVKDVEEGEKRKITEALSCSTWINIKLIIDLYFDDLRFAEEDLAAANDPLYKAGVVYTAPIEMDGRKVFRIALEPKYRTLFTKHEEYFFNETERLGKGRISINREEGRAILVSKSK